MSVKTDLVKEFLVGHIQRTVAERHPHPLRAEIEPRWPEPPTSGR